MKILYLLFGHLLDVVCVPLSVAVVVVGGDGTARAAAANVVGILLLLRMHGN